MKGAGAGAGIGVAEVVATTRLNSNTIVAMSSVVDLVVVDVRELLRW